MLDITKEKDAHIDARLRSDIMVWLATVKPDGTPHIVPVWFLWDGESFYIYSKPDQKIRNLQQNNSVMVALDDTKDGGDPIWLPVRPLCSHRQRRSLTKPDYVPSTNRASKGPNGQASRWRRNIASRSG